MKQTTANTAPINQGLHTFRGALQRLSLTPLLMLLTTASAWAEEYTATYQAKFSPWGNGLYEIILQRSGNTSLKATIAEKSSGWSKNTGVCVNDEYEVTFKPSSDLSIATNPGTTTASGFIMSSGTFTASVANNSNYYIKQVKLLNNAATMGTSAATAPNSRSAQVSVSGSSIQFNYIEVTLTDDYYGTITPQNGLTVGIDATLTDNGTKYYKNGTTIKMNAPTDYIIDEASGVSGTSIAADKRSYTFTMPKQNVTPGATTSEVHTISTPSGLTVTTNPYFTYNTTKYYKKDQTYTLTVDDANKVIQSFSASGASGSSVASDKRSATVTIGTSNVTVSATLLTITGSCGTGLTWTMSGSNGTYDRLTLSGSGTLSTSPWDTDFASSISRVDVSSADITISGNPFSKLGSSVVIIVPTPAYAVSYASAAFASKLRCWFGSYLFSATNEGGTAAYKIATADDLRNLAAAVNAGNDGHGLTFRQTDDIYFDHKAHNEAGADTENNFTPIGKYYGSTKIRCFSGIYDGLGHTISGIRIYTGGNTKTDWYQGLFGMTESDAIIRGITLADTRITGYDYTGGIVGYNRGTVSDCHVAADVTIHTIKSDAKCHGGIVGENAFGTVSECTSAATLTLTNVGDCTCYGGIAGAMQFGTLRNNLAIGAVVPNTKYKHGAICGGNSFGTFENNYYYHCTVAGTENASKVGCDNADITIDNGAVPAYLVTLGNNVTATPTIGTDGANGFSYDSDGDDQAENYYRNGIKLTLATSLSEKTGYHITYKASYNSGNKTLDGNTYTVNGTDGDVTLTAQLTPTDYTITYDLDGGSVTTANPTTYNVETPTFTLNNPTKPGYTFIGWTEGNDNTLMPTVTITKGSSTKDLNYTANYEFARFTQGSLSYEWTGSGTEVEVTACDPSVTSVTIPATVSNDNVTYNVTAIEADAFSGCTDLTSVALYPATPPTLGSGVFSGCTSLNTIYVPSGSAAAYKTAAGWSGYAAKIQGFDGTCGDNVYYAYDSNATTLNIFGTGSMTDYSTTNSPWFSYRMSIKTVVIGNGVTTIGNYAFYSCTSLESITIPDGVTSIGEAAFGRCTSLNSITIPDGVTSIGFDAFGHCTSLNSITIPDGVMSIDNSAFYGCTGLTSIEIPASVTTIGDQAFRDCSKLTSVTIYAPKLDTYGYTVFKDNASGRKIYVPKNSVDTYKSYASKMSFDENDIVGFDGKWGTNVYYAYENDTKTLNIFGTGAMKDDASSNRPWHSYCKDITKVIISDGVTRIGEAAFYGCSSLESVKIPVSVTRIGNYAFYNCSSLESIEIPASVTRIDRFAFAHCTNLLAVILNSETPPTLVSNAFLACTALNAIVVPEDVVAAYKAADGWKDYEDKICNKYGSYGDNVYYAYNSNTKTLYIFGTGYMTEYFGGHIPWDEYRTDITTVVIGHGVTSIGSMAFSDCTGLTSIEIPASVMMIGHDAFIGCTSLKSITIPASVSYIDNYAFKNCTGLTSIEIPASVMMIGRYAFENCTGLTSIEIPANVTQIDSNPFCGCSSLKTISVASGNTVFDSRNNCNAIIMKKTKTLITGCKNSVIPNGVMYIDFDAFYGCTGLTSIDIPASVTAIYGSAFMGCTGLTSIEIPASVTNIDQWAFGDCTSLNSVTIYAPELSEYGYGYGAFYNNADGRKIYVFKNCLDTYKSGWSNYASDIQAITDINLRDNDDNRSLVEAANDNALGALNVTLQGRKLYKDGAWNTLCLPFDVTIKGSVLDGDDVKAMVLDDKTSGLNGDELTLNFVDAPATIPAGTPFIIKWKQAAILENPVFTGVTINKTAPEVAFNGGWFEGTYRPVNWAVEDQNILFLGDANTLYYPKAGAHLNAFRAYFLLEDDSNFGAREIVVNFGEETTGVVSMHNSECLMLNKADAWYTVNGVKLDGKPTAKGMYIHGGRKVVIK